MISNPNHIFVDTNILIGSYSAVFDISKKVQGDYTFSNDKYAD
jgi:hypothetical protein